MTLIAAGSDVAADVAPVPGAGDVQGVSGLGLGPAVRAGQVEENHVDLVVEPVGDAPGLGQAPDAAQPGAGTTTVLTMVLGALTGHGDGWRGGDCG